jgi:hypothetical protein
MAYCETAGFAAYDHGAYFFDLEPKATRHLAEANVIFLGNSKAQFAFSSRAREAFFRAHPAHYYLLGFNYNEKSDFALLLLRKYHPPLKTAVINADPFFAPGFMSPVAREVTEGSFQIWLANSMKKIAGPVQQTICRNFTSWCRPRKLTLYRSKATGAWNTAGHLGGYFNARKKLDSTAAKDIAPAEQEKALLAARSFLQEFKLDPKCVVFTSIPSETDDGSALAKRLAQALGGEVILPGVPDLRMRDPAHLEEQSAERWSTAFLQQYEPILKRCLQSSATADNVWLNSQSPDHLP